MLNNLVESVVAAIAASGIESSVPHIVGWIKNATQNVPGQERFESEEIKEIAEKMASQGSFNLGLEISKRNLSRWFEIPEEEFMSTPKEQLEPEVLIRHVALENLFKGWFKEWRYEVEIGEDLEGLEDIEFVADLYAKRVTLHGTFEVVVCLVCDYPPNIYRTRAMFETFESYAREGADFGERDIFIIATPFKFGKSITQSIALQNKEEDYTVVALEGDDIARLQEIKEPDKRLLELKEFVGRAQNKLIKEACLFKK